MLGRFGNGQGAYSEVQVDARASVSNSFELVCMLHDGLLEQVNSMVMAIEREDVEMKLKSANKALEILAGLESSLDLESGYELILEIHRLYQFCMSTIGECIVSQDTESLDGLKVIISDLKEGWEGALREVGAP
ncbi:flagellar export chaperone FliS [Vibrio sp. PNB22_3_1]